MRRERQWGLFGGLVCAVFGVGSALIAVYVEGASWSSSSTPYPQFFARHRLLTYDYFLASALIVGVMFQIGALWTARTGRYPRTDTFGGILVGTILMLLAGVLLFDVATPVIVAAAGGSGHRVKGRASRQNVEGWARRKTTPAPPVSKPARPPRRPGSPRPAPPKPR